MKRYLILIVLLLTFCGEDTVEETIIETTEVTEVAYDKTYTSPPEMSINEQAKYIATIETSLGTLVIDLYADIAPKTVNNFVNISKKISEKIKYKDSYIKNLTKECFTKGYLKSSKKGLAGGTLTKKSLKILTSL